MTAFPPDSSPASTFRQLELGLRWLQAGDEPRVNDAGTASWSEFLARAERLPANRRLRWARLWPATALPGGALALSGLLIWPHGSGIHLLLFLLVFGLMPLGLMLWHGFAGLVLGRGPWWQRLLIGDSDPVLGLWCARQSLLAQGLFWLAGLGWLWLMLATRQVMFYWSTSIPAVSGRVAESLRVLSLGLVEPPAERMIAAAEAGAVTGWRGELLADTTLWAVWLSQVTALWLLPPFVLLLVLCQWRLSRRVRYWPRWNSRLRRLYDQLSEPAVHYRAMQGEEPASTSSARPMVTVSEVPRRAGFAWQTNPADLPPGSLALGDGGFAADAARIRERGSGLDLWYIEARTVPTGDLADLLALHREIGAETRLCLLARDCTDEELRRLRRTWSSFLERQRLDLPVTLVTVTGGASDNGAFPDSRIEEAP